MCHVRLDTLMLRAYSYVMAYTSLHQNPITSTLVAGGYTPQAASAGYVAALDELGTDCLTRCPEWHVVAVAIRNIELPR